MCAWVGGKAKNADHILCVLNHPSFDSMEYVELFVGMGHILRRVKNKSSYSASDNNELLIHLLKAIQEGKQAPHITREEYTRLKGETGVVSLERASAAITHSFNGKVWGGYTHTYNRRDGRVDDIPEGRRKYYRKLQGSPSFMEACLACVEYREWEPTCGALIYLDPPYAGTTQYGKAKFDSASFWAFAERLSMENLVFVSEYIAPEEDWVCVAMQEKSCCLAGGNKQDRRVEKLFVHRSAQNDMRWGATISDMLREKS